MTTCEAAGPDHLTAFKVVMEMIAAHTGLWLKVFFLPSNLFLQFILDDLLRVVVRVRVRNIFVSKMIVQMILLWTSLLHSRQDYPISSDKGYEPSIFRRLFIHNWYSYKSSS